MHFILVAICLALVVCITSVGTKEYGKVLLCVMIIMVFGPLGLIFAYFYWKKNISKGKT